MAAQLGKAEMLIRRPVGEVFKAFVDPETITKFWLTSTSGPLARNARVTWEFMVPGATDTVTVTDFQHERHIAFDWSDGMSVAMDFERWNGDATRVVVRVSGFKGDDVVDQIVGVTEGFSIVLCDLKSLLETGRSGNFVRDKAELIARP